MTALCRIEYHCILCETIFQVESFYCTDAQHSTKLQEMQNDCLTNRFFKWIIFTIVALLITNKMTIIAKNNTFLILDVTNLISSYGYIYVIISFVLYIYQNYDGFYLLFNQKYHSSFENINKKGGGIYLKDYIIIQNRG